MLSKLIKQDVLYSPILKWKQGEYRALKDLQNNVASRILPLIVIPPFLDWDHEDGKILTPGEHVKKFGPRLRDHWGRRPILIDGMMLDMEAPQEVEQDHALSALMQRARSSGALAIPVTGLTRSEKYQAAVKRSVEIDQLGAAIRLTLGDLESARFELSIDRLMSKIGCSPEKTHLYVDFEARSLGSLDAFAELLISRINLLPHLHHWRTLCFAATEFPFELKTVKSGACGTFRRGEWMLYEKVFNSRGELGRVPLFSDYAIEHPNFPAVRKGPIRASVHLRYTTPNSWVVAKGPSGVGYEGIRDACGLINGLNVFMGENYSSGDNFIARQLKRLGGAGGPSEWRSAGTNHHITLVTKTMADLNEVVLTPLPAASGIHEKQDQFAF